MVTNCIRVITVMPRFGKYSEMTNAVASVSARRLSLLITSTATHAKTNMKTRIKALVARMVSAAVRRP